MCSLFPIYIYIMSEKVRSITSENLMINCIIYFRFLGFTPDELKMKRDYSLVSCWSTFSQCVIIADDTCCSKRCCLLHSCCFIDSTDPDPNCNIWSITCTRSSLDTFTHFPTLWFCHRISFIYMQRGSQKVSKISIGIIVAVWLAAAVCFFVALSNHSWFWLISVFKYIYVMLNPVPLCLVHYDINP